MFDILGSDIVVMQELKIQRKDLRDDMVILDGWDCYFSLPKHKKGYSGVGIYTRNATCAPIKAEEGLLGVLPSSTGGAYRDLPDEQSIGGYPTEAQIMEIGVDPMALDAEGRCVVLEFPAFVLFGVYSPANSNGLRDDFRFGFICTLDCRIRNLIAAGKNVVLVGDLNVSRSEIDTASAMEDLRKEGLTHEDYVSTPNRRVFNQLLIGGDVVGERDAGRERGVLWDTTREFHPDRMGMYTHWEQKINARPGNFGSRIDFVLVSEEMKPWIRDANIQEGLLGSDHCPVYADFEDDVNFKGKEMPLVDIMSPSGTFVGGVRKREWKSSSTPAFSAKRLPEFDKRRSIKAMFTAPALIKSQTSQTETEEAVGNGAMAKSERSPEKSHFSTKSQPASSSPVKNQGRLLSKESPTKRTKTENGALNPKGQQSLKGFFQAKPKPQDPKIQDLNSSYASISRSGQRDNVILLQTNDHNGSDIADATRAAKRRRVDPNDQPERGDVGSEPQSTLGPEKDAGTGVAREDVLPSDSTRATTPDRPVSQQEMTCADSTPPHSARQATNDLSPSDFDKRLNTSSKWNNLFTRPAAPICEGHNEPCKTMLTKKKGTNQGRSFWMCARPLGPSGQKEKNTEWRCGTFIWATDWKGSGG